MKIALIVISVVALAIAVGVGIRYYKTVFYVPDKGGMERDLSDTVVSCYYTTGGGMDGGSMSMRIYLADDNGVRFEYSNTPCIGAQEETADFQIPCEALELIRSKCKEFGVLQWGRLGYDEITVLDAPTTTVGFVFGENENYSVNSNYKLPENATGFFSEFYGILNQYNQQGGN